MSRFKLSDLPPEYQRQALAQLEGRQPAKAQASPVPEPPTPKQRKPGDAASRKPNSTEAEYARIFLRGKDARFEALTFRLANGHRYTPDWIVLENGLPVEAHEVKGSYRLHSHQRSRLAFDQARIEFPGIKWFWNGKETQ